MRKRLIRSVAPASQVSTGDYTVEILGRRYAAIDMVRASRIVETIRDQHGYGASEMGGQFPVRDGDAIIGYVSYNGRVWMGHPDRWKNAVLVYDPSNKAHRDAHQVPDAATPSRIVRSNPGSGCAVHDTGDECRADRASCRFGGCDGVQNFQDGTCKTPARHYDDTKSFFCDEHRKKFLKDYRWDDRQGMWVER